MRFKTKIVLLKCNYHLHHSKAKDIETQICYGATAQTFSLDENQLSTPKYQNREECGASAPILVAG